MFQIQHPPNFHSFTWIVINSSGGKDSQTALRAVVEEAQRQTFPLNRIVISHQDLGDMEWEGTQEIARAQANHYGLRFEVVRYRNKAGEEKSLLDYVEERGMFPSSSTRFCTSEFKRGPGGRLLTRLSRERMGDILQVFGFRAEESPARSKKPVYALNTRFSVKTRKVWDWLPIHHITKEEVWADIRASGVPYHYAYDLGMPRLSCAFCIFAPKPALLLAGRHNPQLLDRYVKVEQKIGHTFKPNLALADIKRELATARATVGEVLDWEAT